MKVCLYNVTTSFKTGGIETVVKKMAYYLKKMQVNVEIVAGRSNKMELSREDIKEFFFISRNRFPNFGNRFRKMGERLSFLPFSIRYVLKQNYDIFIIFKPYDLIAACILKNFSNSKIVFCSGGTDFFLGDILFKNIPDVYVCCSRFNASQIENHYKVKARVIYNGVDTEVFFPNKKVKISSLGLDLKIPENARIILSVGRLVGWKGHSLLIKAAKNLEKENIIILIAGEGPQREILYSLIKKLKLEKKVFLLGNIKSTNMPLLYNIADIYCHPSIGEEAFGISIIEAMACGIPVIGTKSGAIPEVVGDAGVIVEKDPLMISRSILYLLKNPSTYKNFSQKGRERVCKNFSWESIIKQYKKLFEELIY